MLVAIASFADTITIKLTLEISYSVSHKHWYP